MSGLIGVTVKNSLLKAQRKAQYRQKAHQVQLEWGPNLGKSRLYDSGETLPASATDLARRGHRMS